jgi:hypothetical protein
MPFLMLFVVSALTQGAACSKSSQETPMPDLVSLQKMTARFAPVEISAGTSHLPDAEQQALTRMLEAGLIMDTLYLRQVWAGNEALLEQLQRDTSPLGTARLHYFRINKGPWSRLDHNAPFIPGVPEKPLAANFYPQGATKGELEAWLNTLSGKERESAVGFFTVIRGAAGGARGFVMIPYSAEYDQELARAAALLREAASLTAQPTLKAYLTSRADAFLSNDYYASDIAWMELDASIEPTIGPYEVYEDEWFNAKAAFEAFVTIRDDAETAKLVTLSGQLQDIEDHLPIDAKYRNPRLGSLAPIRVVNEILAAGDGNRGVQTAAFNLPNDERVVKEKGSKRVMLKNVQEAKFRIVLVPISQIVLSPSDRKNVSFDAFFTHILMHELMHGLGPHEIRVADRTTTVRQELRETYSTIEEAKADISGLFALQYLIDKGVIDKSLERSIYDTFLASAFRSIRFGINEAHGRGIAIQLNYLMDTGAFRITPEGTFAVVPAKIKDGVIALTREIMTLEAEGDYVRAREMQKDLGVVRPEIQAALDRLQDIPVDIEPQFPAVQRLISDTKNRH